MRSFVILPVASLLVLLAVTVVALPTFGPQIAALPHWTAFDGIRYQAQLNGSDGQPVSDGPHQLEFSLWDDPTAGNRLWVENQTIQVTGGLLNARLGAVTPILVDSLGMPGGDTLRLLYFEVAVDGETLSPRARLSAMPFARVAERLLGDLESGKGLLRLRDDDGGVPFELNHDLDGTSMFIVDSFFDIEYRVEYHTADSGAYLTVANIGSSGQDGVRSYSRPSGSGTYAIDSFFDITYRVDLAASDSGAVLRVQKQSGEPAVARGLSILTDPDSTGLFMVDSFFDIEYRIVFQGAPGGALGDMSSTSPDGTARRIRWSTTSSTGRLTVSNLGSSGEDGVRIEVDDIGPKLTMVDSTGGGGLDGTKTYEFTMRPDRIEFKKGAVADPDTSQSELSHDQLTISNIGSSGEDGVRLHSVVDSTVVGMARVESSGDTTRSVRIFTVPPQPILTARGGAGATFTHSSGGGGGGGRVIIRATEAASTVGIEHEDIGLTMRAEASGGTLTVANIGSSGDDGVSMEVGPTTDGTGLMRSKLFVGGLSTLEGATIASDIDSTVVGLLYGGGGGAGGTVRLRSSALGGELRVTSRDVAGNEGFVVADGVRLVLAEQRSGRSVQTEILSMDLSGSSPAIGLRPPGSDPTDPLVFELSPLGDVELRRVDPATGDERFVLVDDGRIRLAELRSGRSVQTEILSMDLSAASPIIGIRPLGSLPADPFAFEVSPLGDVELRRVDPATGDERFVLLDDGRIRLAELKSGRSVQTEILSMDLSGASPIIGIRPLGSLPADPFAFEVSPLGDLTVRSFDPVGTEQLILLGDGRVSLREHRSGGVQTEILSMSLTGTDPVIFVRPVGSAASAPASFSLTDRGHLYLFGGAEMAQDPTSRVVIGPGPAFTTLTVHGDLCTTTGLVTSCSDERFKKNIDSIEGAMDKVLKLRGVNFNWRTEEFEDRHFKEGRQTGFIAQEIKEVMPEVVIESVDGYYAVDYGRLTPLLVAAIQDQQKTIDELREKVSENERLQERLSSLESAVEKLLAERNDGATGQKDLAVAN